jgi:glycosyltransferase involved in cell wall biosynthesis
MRPTISLILNTYENPLALEKVLRALSRQTDASAQIIVADDGSGPATGEVVRSFREKLRIMHCRQQHEGFRRSVILNKAIAESTSEYLVFLDGDSVPAREFIADHTALAERGCWVQGRRAFVDESCVDTFEPSLGHVWSLALRGKLSGLLKAVRLPFPVVKRGREQRGILGCNLGIWRDDLIAVNGYDETFTGWGREDTDLGNRLYHLGRDRKFVYGRAIIYHLNHPVVSRDRLQTNQSLLEETLREKRIRARMGLDQYLNNQQRESAGISS